MPKRIESHEETISEMESARQYAEMAKKSSKGTCLAAQPYPHHPETTRVLAVPMLPALS